MKRRLAQYLRPAYFNTFLMFDRLGLHIMPKSYYSPVPDCDWLARHKDAWIGRSSLPGIRWDLDRQLEWVREICRPYYAEVIGLGFYRDVVVKQFGPGFGAIESQVLHCFVRAKAPSRIVEIGGGVSTACLLHAADLNKNEGRPHPQIICVEPYPQAAFRGIDGITHIEQPCQTVPSSIFSQLRPGDLLFVDSTHAVKVGSEVMRIYLDIIPRLEPGVFIHIHDIFLPYLYPRSTFAYPAWSQETALLLALMINNRHLTTLACLAALHYDRPADLAAVLCDYRPQENLDGLAPGYPSTGHFPTSIWLRTVEVV